MRGKKRQSRETLQHTHKAAALDGTKRDGDITKTKKKKSFHDNRKREEPNNKQHTNLQNAVDINLIVTVFRCERAREK